MKRELHVFPSYENLTNGASRPIFQFGKSILFKLLALMVSAKIWRQRKSADKIFMLSDGLRDQLSILPEEHATISFDTSLIQSLETLDAKFVSEFCNCLYKETENLAWRGISILDVCELRWLPTALENFARILAIRREQLKVPDLNIRIHGLSNANIASLLPDTSSSVFSHWLGRLGSEQKSAQLRDFLIRIAHQFTLAPSGDDRVPTIAMPQEKTLLVIASFDRTLERFIRILPDIRRQFNGLVHVLCTHERVDYRKYGKLEGLSFSYIADWQNEAELKADLAETRQQSLAMHARLEELDRRLRGFSIDGVYLFQACRPGLEAVLKSGSKASLMALHAASRAIEALKPYMILNFEDWELNRSATRLAQRLKIPTLAYYCLTPSWHSDALIHRSQEYMAVAGKQLADVFARQYDKKHLRIVGDPIIHSLGDETLRMEQRQAFRKKMGLGSEQKLILMLSSYPILGVSKRSLVDVFRKTAECAASIPNTRMVVKAHPAQSISQLRDWLAEAGVDAEIIQDSNLFAYCCAADLVSATISSSTTQALLAQVPVVCFVKRRALNLYELRGNDYLAGGGVRCLDGDADYVAQVQALLCNPDERERQVERGNSHVTEHVGGVDRRAGIALTDFMADILGEMR